MKRVVLDFTPDEVQRILAIDLDGDQREALNFIRETLAKRIKERLIST